jgi:gamma-aminobutyric acid receptor subunit beta
MPRYAHWRALVKTTLQAIAALIFAGSVVAETVFAEPCFFPEHDLSAPPVEAPAVVDIEIELYLNDVTGIDDSSQSFTSDVFMRAEWMDARLAHDGLTACTVEELQIWTPGLKLLNRREIEALSPPELKVEPDGRVIRVVRAYGDFTFREDLSAFPFDHQEVHFSVVAGYGPDQVNFIAPRERIGLAEQMSVANWRISAGENRFSDYYIAPLERTLARLDVVFKAERLTGFYTWQLLVPLFLVVMMTWTVFWMPLEFVAPRVGLVATSMLTLIAYRFSMASILPPIAYLTRLDVFMVASSVLVFAALATTVAVTYFEGRGLTTAALRLNTAARWLAPLLFLAAFTRVFLL